MVDSKSFTEALQIAISRRMKAIDMAVERMIDPLLDVGSPEKVIGKPIQLWDSLDYQRATVIYGMRKPNPLTRLIVRSKLAELEKLKQGVV